ncbi:MAG: GNAT family N-acetyltransferase [Oscillospiraceae bacterium]|nr:GNAT family N-acetyltransferase [Oscillospiraceae bacterium]
MDISKTVTIRPADTDDAPYLLDIYSYYVENTAVSFEYTPPSLEEFRRRMCDTLKNYPYLVAESDRPIGYIYAGRFRTRAAYDLSAETSIYIDRAYHRQGIGRRLYEKLESILLMQNVTNIYAGASSPTEDNDQYLTRNSELFHNAIGYRTTARFHRCGNKFGRWYDLIETEKIIAEHISPPGEFIPFPEIKDMVLRSGII